MELIKLQGDWRSDVYLLYLLIPLADRLILSQTLTYHVGLAVFIANCTVIPSEFLVVLIVSYYFATIPVAV